MSSFKELQEEYSRTLTKNDNKNDNVSTKYLIPIKFEKVNDKIAVHPVGREANKHAEITNCPDE